MGGTSQRHGDSQIHPVARLLGSSSSGILEILLFHPFDTTGKRLMSHTARKGRGVPMSETIKKANSIIFRDFAEVPFPQRYLSLYRGVGAAAAYKIGQRVIRFGGQPIAAEYVHENFNSKAVNLFGDKWAKPMIHASTGALMGVTEVAIVPLDVFKIKRQVNPDAFQGRTSWEIARTIGVRNLYAGATWTALRNAPGSFALFGGAAFTKESILKLDDFNKATWADDFYASCVGSTLCITVANPIDVVKTRVQKENFGSKTSGIEIIRNVLQHEGPLAFYKGFIPKAVIVAPKLIFAFTTSQQFVQFFHNGMMKN